MKSPPTAGGTRETEKRRTSANGRLRQLLSPFNDSADCLAGVDAIVMHHLDPLYGRDDTIPRILRYPKPRRQ